MTRLTRAIHRRDHHSVVYAENGMPKSALWPGKRLFGRAWNLIRKA